MSAHWSGRWFKLGTLIHAEKLGARETLCGNGIRREAVPIKAELTDEYCAGCWRAAA